MVRLRLALVGENIGYSRSPEIFAAIFKQDGVAGEYDVCSVAASALDESVRRLVDSGINGFSVTTPHKESIMALLNEIDPVARTIGAVNCVAVEGDRLVGYNTDWSGLVHALEPHAAVLDGRPALVMGTGGAARAAIYALWKAFDIDEFVVASRSPDNVAGLRHHLEGMPGRLTIAPIAVPVGSDVGERAVINCTPLGGSNYPDASPFAPSFDWSTVSLYCDLNYNHGNRLIKDAVQVGRPVVDGSCMLVAQALDAYEIWTGRRMRFQTTYAAVFGSDHGR